MGFFDIFKKKEKVEEQKVQSVIEFVTIGDFGKFAKNKIETNNIAKEKVLFWENLIQSNSQYIVNYFMSMPLRHHAIEEWWDNWCFSEKEKSLGKLQIAQLRDEREKQLLSEIDLYLDKQNPIDIKELYKKYLPYFDYDGFMKSVKIEYMSFDDNYFSIQLSDRKMEFFCSAYESFDKDLKGTDWHNF